MQNTETTVKQRLIDFLSYKKIGQKRFAESCGLSAGFVNAISKSIQPDTMNRISMQYPELNPGWVLTGEGEMLRGIENNSSENIIIQNFIPVIPFDAIAGYSGFDIPGISLNECDKYVVPEFKDSGAEFILRVSGSSMYPKYSNGDLLACRKVHEILFFQWGKIYVIDSSQGAMIKRIYENEKDQDMIICHSDNTEHYPRFSIPKSDIRSLSIVLGVIRME